MDCYVVNGRGCMTGNANVPYVLKKREMLRGSQNKMFLCTKFPYSKEESLDSTFILF